MSGGERELSHVSDDRQRGLRETECGQTRLPMSSLKSKRSGWPTGVEKKVRTTQGHMDKRFLFIAREGKLCRVLKKKKWMVNGNQLVVIITYLSCVKHH